VLIAIGINWEGQRQVLGVELANRESQSTWRDFLIGLKQRGLTGVEVAVSDDHAGLRKAIEEILPEAAWQRCYVHFLRNALDHLPRKADDDCLQETALVVRPAQPRGGPAISNSFTTTGRSPCHAAAACREKGLRSARFHAQGAEGHVRSRA